jgi:hypothetical protein
MEYLIGLILPLVVAGFAIILGFDRGRSFYPTVLIVIASYYVFFDFSHGQSLLGHSVSPLARGEIPIGCPAPLSAPAQKA